MKGVDAHLTDLIGPTWPALAAALLILLLGISYASQGRR